MKRFRFFRGRKQERIDPFGVGEPWRHHVRGALQAGARYDRAVGGLAAGPLRERLEEIRGRVEEAKRECWWIAQRGSALDDVVSILDARAIRGQLAARTSTAAAPESPEDPVATSLLAQLAAAERLTGVVADARERLALLEARLGEAVATAVELSIRVGDGADTSRLRGDVDLVVEDLVALSSALEESGGPGT